ncbi:MAG: phosphatidate cytidylyltransferase [Verrucomicrobiales bacterium]|nr:phosphatidate cytidylyltransferase [Verrucomicrobiales bacterium]
MTLPREVLQVFGGILAVLLAASATGLVLARVRPGPTVSNLNSRIRAWWVMSLVFAVALASGRTGATLLFCFMSFLALREFVTLTPSSRADHRALVLEFFLFLPGQYVLVALAWYGLFSIFIPVYAFLLIAVRLAAAGDTEHFLERTAKIQWGLMVCVYCLSHAPMLLTLEIPGYAGRSALLLLFLVVVVQASDVLQYIWGKCCGKRKIAPGLSPNKTVEGFAGGVLSATALGAGLWWMTPFTVWQAALLALLACFMGFLGGLVMSAIKRDRGVKDFGEFIEGHGGMLDRIDSLCFAAPVFFHAVRWFWVP